jgi:prolyl-tRNA synthetase
MSQKSQTAITPTRVENFPEWYQAVIKAAQMAENAPVRGCMVIRPYGYALWEKVQTVLGQMIKDNGVQNAYFPLLIPVSYLSKEAEHIEGFAKECAVVTHHRLEKGPEGNLIPAGPLTEPYVIRPTSETIIGEVIRDWISSYRDLPLKLNQWCNVMRWEMRTRLFLRTSEFLWQEGHNCFATASEAEEDSRLMLDMYVEFLRDYMAIPGIMGFKTEDEKFPGAVATRTYESMMQDGKAVQMCTSHDLGQTFSKSAEIRFLDREGERQYAYTTSWGLSTRTIGGLLMCHGDDNGAVIPPKMAEYPVRIIPIIRDEAGAEKVLDAANKLKKALAAQGVASQIDTREDKTPNKVWLAIKQGVPVRVEIGERDIDQDQVSWFRRDQDPKGRLSLSTNDFVAQINDILTDIQSAIYAKAENFLNGNMHQKNDLSAIRAFFAGDNVGFVKAPLSVLTQDDFNALKTDFAVTARCLPFADDGKMVLLGRSY